MNKNTTAALSVQVPFNVLTVIRSICFEFEIVNFDKCWAKLKTTAYLSLHVGSTAEPQALYTLSLGHSCSVK